MTRHIANYEARNPKAEMRKREGYRLSLAQFWSGAFGITLLCLFQFAVGWCSAAAQEPTQPTARELLVDVTAADWDHLATAETFDEHDASLLRVLRRIQQIGYEPMFRLAEPETSLDNSSASLGRLFAVRGDVLELREVTVPPTADRPESGLTYYVLRIARNSESIIDVAACEIPAAWQGKIPLENPHFGCRGYFLGWTGQGSEKIPLFAARRIEWYPRQEMDGVSAGMARLGRDGIDVGMLDAASARAGQKLDRDESMFLMSMLAQAARATAEVRDLPTWEIVELLKQPVGLEGSCRQLRGTVERITPIDVNQNPLAELWGVKNYYQLDLFVSIGDRRLNILDRSKSNALTFDYDYPATVLVTSLPAELQAANYSGQMIEVPSFFYRLWSFPTIMSRRVDPERQQVAPLFVGGTVRVITPDSKSFSNTVSVAVLIGIGSLAIFAVWIWISSRRDQRRRSRPTPQRIDFGLPPSEPHANRDGDRDAH